MKRILILLVAAAIGADRALDAPNTWAVDELAEAIVVELDLLVRGAEIGLTWNVTRGLDVRASAAFQSIVANSGAAVCGPCTQAPTVKVNGGFVYRTPVNLDLSADVSYVTGTTWVEREPSPSDPTQILNVRNALPGFAVINARVAYRLLNDRVTFAVVGQQLGPNHQEHPFGNDVNRRVFAQLTVQP